MLARLDQAATQPEWAWLKQVPAVRILEQTWAQQYRHVDGHAQRLSPKEMPPVSEWYRSPYDAAVRYGRKRDFDWIGYKVHLSECCDDDLPHLQHLFTAVATNILRLVRWLEGVPLAKTRTSRFATLAA